jgi:hypothetical protein
MKNILICILVAVVGFWLGVGLMFKIGKDRQKRESERMIILEQKSALAAISEHKLTAHKQLRDMTYSLASLAIARRYPRGVPDITREERERMILDYQRVMLEYYYSTFPALPTTTTQLIRYHG